MAPRYLHMALNNTYDRSRDPRLSHRPSNIEMTDEVSTVSMPKSETALENNRLLAIISSTGDSPTTNSFSNLLARIADQEADNARLQREKTEVKAMERDLHGRLNQTTQSLNTLTASYARGLREKDTILSENLAIEQRHTKMRAEAVDYAYEICAMTTKIQEMEEQTQAYEIENTKLRGHLTKLETELNTLQLRVRDLESEQKQGRIPDNAVRDMWNGSNDPS